MRILVVGSGGREHALAWALARSPQVEHVYVAPGNAGTAALGTNVPIAVTDVAALVDFARTQHIDLTVAGATRRSAPAEPPPGRIPLG